MKKLSLVGAICIALAALAIGWFSNALLKDSDMGTWSAAGAVLTAVATIVLVIVTALLWNVTERSAQSARLAADAASESARIAGEASSQAADIAKKQLRAYVLVEGSILSCDADGQHLPYVHPGSRPIGQVSFKNTGQTPALDLRVQIRIATRNEPASSEEFTITNEPSASSMSLGAGHSATSMAAAPAVIGLSSTQNLMTGSEAIYVFGEINYQDIFGENHTTGFRLRNKSGVGDGAMTFTNHGNTAT